MINIDKLNLPVCALGAGAVHVVVLALVLPLSIKLPQASETMTASQVAIQVEILPEAPVAQPEVSSNQPEVSSNQSEVSSIQPVAQPLVVQPLVVQSDTINGLLQNVSVTTAGTTVTPNATEPVIPNATEPVIPNAPEPVGLPDATDDITGSLPEAASVMDEAATPLEVVPEERLPVETVPTETVPSEVVSDEVDEAVSDDIAEVDEGLPSLPTRVRRDAHGTAIITVRRVAPKPVRRAARADPPRAATVKRNPGPFQGPLGALFGRSTNNRTR